MTLERRWEREGKIQSVRTDGGHRRYDIDTLVDFKETRHTVAYARVSSHDQKADLERLALVLEADCLHHSYYSLMMKLIKYLEIKIALEWGLII